jgi:protein-disulfide isomerase
MIRHEYASLARWVGVFVLTVSILTFYNLRQRANSNSYLKNRASMHAESLPQSLALAESDHIRGNILAPVTVIEYADIECTFCKRFEGTMQELYQAYGTTGQVRFVFRHFPLGIWDHSIPEAIAAECAGEQNGSAAFYEYLNRLFQLTPSENNSDLTVLSKISASMGLDEQQFQRCSTEPATKERVTSEHLSGVRAGVSTVPTTFIIGPQSQITKIVGNKPYTALKTIIDTMLAASANALQ